MGFASIGAMGKVGRRRIVDGSSPYRAGTSAKQIKGYTNTQTSGLYWVKPTQASAAQQVHCEMQLDGGGWMLIARTHPGQTGLTSSNWGWLGDAYGAVNSYEQAYHLGWKNWYNAGARITEFMFCNRLNKYNSAIGPFAYKRSNVPITSIMTADGAIDYNTSYSVIKADTTSGYSSNIFPAMQLAAGVAQSVVLAGSALYHMRDMTPISSYGLTPNGMNSEYYGTESDDLWNHCGPWGIRDGSVDANNSFIQNANNPKLGGTAHAMLFVR